MVKVRYLVLFGLLAIIIIFHFVPIYTGPKGYTETHYVSPIQLRGPLNDQICYGTNLTNDEYIAKLKAPSVRFRLISNNLKSFINENKYFVSAYSVPWICPPYTDVVQLKLYLW